MKRLKTPALICNRNSGSSCPSKFCSTWADGEDEECVGGSIYWIPTSVGSFNATLYLHACELYCTFSWSAPNLFTFSGQLGSRDGVKVSSIELLIHDNKKSTPAIPSWGFPVISVGLRVKSAQEEPVQESSMLPHNRNVPEESNYLHTCSLSFHIPYADKWSLLTSQV